MCYDSIEANFTYTRVEPEPVECSGCGLVTLEWKESEQQ